MIIHNRNNINPFDAGEKCIAFLAPTKGPINTIARSICKKKWKAFLKERERDLVSVKKHTTTSGFELYALSCYTPDGWINPSRTVLNCLNKINANSIALVVKNYDSKLMEKILAGVKFSNKKVNLYRIDDNAILV